MSDQNTFDRYWAGLFTGVTGTAIVLLVLFVAAVVPSLSDAYREFKGANLPWSTQLVLGVGWRFGAPLVLSAITIALNVLRPSPRKLTAAMVCMAAFALLLLAWSVAAAYQPFFELSMAIDAG